MHIHLGDSYYHRASLIHGRDPRVKVAGALLYIFAVGLTPAGAWWAYAAFLALIIATAWMARLSPALAIRRSFLALPFALAALALPFTVPGPPSFEVPVLGWKASQPGLVRFASVLLRSWLAVQAAVLLTATTRFPDLLWALETLRLPRPLAGVIGFTYRYLFIIADEALRLNRARASRAIRRPGRRRPPLGWQARVAGGMVGNLFLRAMERSERVYAAMVARGYDGHMRLWSRHRMQASDWGALGAFAILLFSASSLAYLG